MITPVFYIWDQAYNHGENIQPGFTKTGPFFFFFFFTEIILENINSHYCQLSRQSSYFFSCLINVYVVLFCLQFVWTRIQRGSKYFSKRDWYAPQEIFTL